MSALQKIRYPKQIKPPDRVGHEFAHYERPGLAMGYEAGPFDFRHRHLRIAANVMQFRPGNTWMLLGPAVKQQPKCKPDETRSAGNQKRPSPSPVHSNRRHYEGSDDGSEV